MGGCHAIGGWLKLSGFYMTKKEFKFYLECVLSS